MYLDDLDHFVKEVLRAPEYLRYMDDFALFHDDPAVRSAGPFRHFGDGNNSNAVTMATMPAP